MNLFQGKMVCLKVPPPYQRKLSNVTNETPNVII